MGMKGEVLSLEATFDKFDVLKAFHRYRILNYIYTWLYIFICDILYTTHQSSFVPIRLDSLEQRSCQPW